VTTPGQDGTHGTEVPDPVPRAARRPHTIARSADTILDASLIGFATWTLVFHLAIVLGLRADVTFALWTTVIIALAVAVRCKSRRPFPMSRADRSEVAIDPLLAAVAAIAGVGVGFTAGYIRLRGASWLAFAGAVTIFCISALVVIMRSPRRKTRPRFPSRLGEAAVLLAAVGLAGLGLFGRNWNPDDVVVLNRSVAIEADGGEPFPVRDTLYSDEVFAYSRPDDPPTSIEPLIGTLARAVPVTAPTLAHQIIAPGAAALAVLSLWRLLRAIRAPNPEAATVCAVGFLVLAGETARSASAGLMSLHQGKFILGLVVIPLAWRHALVWSRDGDPRAAALLIASGIAGVGLSSSSLFLLPVVIVIGTIAGLASAEMHPGRLGAALAALVYPIASGVHAVVADPQPALVAPASAAAERVSVFIAHVPAPSLSTPAGAWWSSIGHGATAALSATAMLTAWLVVRDRGGRLVLVLAPLALFGGLLLPPVYNLMAETWNARELLWRTTWILPVAASVGCVLSSPALVRDAGLRRISRWVVPVAAATTLLALGTPVTSRVRAWSMLPPPLDLPADSESAARELVAAAARNSVVAGPVGVEEVLAATSVQVRTVNPRPRDLPGYAGVPEFQADDRRLVSAALSGVDPTTGAAPEDVVAALNRLDVSALCLPAILLDERWAADLAAAGFTSLPSETFCTYWRRDPPPGPTTDS